MDIDTMTIIDHNISKYIYPLLEMNYNNQEYVFYLKELLPSFQKSDIYVGQVTKDGMLVPISEDLLNFFDQEIDQLITQYSNKQS